ncbi:MAG TPA: isovaleryl-CoA dehydrogenase [Pyrinomonadaceae bacterium]|nr:isovaleryl-CoA dehydrogenase [Pyrinomonadaceae bacterium]
MPEPSFPNSNRTPDEVSNQPPPLEDYNLFAHDAQLQESLRREGGAWGESQSSAFGALMGQAATLRLGELANRYLPVLHTHDRFGHRIDEVEFHPAWHELMRIGIAGGHHSLPWTNARPGAHVVRAALNMLRHQVDEGSSCPLTMTFAVVPSLRLQPELAAEWLPLVLSNEYDPRSVPAQAKSGVLFGMALTERQGGSDVQSNTTRAVPLGKTGEGREYELTGHKWFCSAPMCDAFLTLARTDKGLSCFLLPRWRPDGTRNGFLLQRLKNKLGNRSNASSEVEFHSAWARLLGEEGRGVPAIIEMVRHTRLDCAFGSAATMRRAVAEATHHAMFRYAFGKRLLDQPLMRNVLADLCLEVEAATALALRLARGFDESPQNEAQRKFTRLATAAGKYWITKRAVPVVAEALECLGGTGYIEESPLPRLYRDAPVNSIWEGSGNVQCLDLLRAVQRDASTLEVTLQEIRAGCGGNHHFDNFTTRLESEFSDLSQLEIRARRLTELLALGLQGSLLVQHAPTEIADAFCASRLTDSTGLAFGTLPASTNFEAIIQRSCPQV